MDDLYHNSPRQVLPRWRTLARTPGHELEASRRRHFIAPSISVDNSKELVAWQRSHGVVEAAELLELAALGGKSEIVEDAAYWVIRNADNHRPGVVRLAKVFLGLQKPIDDAVPNTYLSNPAILQFRIKSIKERLIEHPRDAISRTDLARLYLLLGQRDKAAESIDIATRISPDNRFVLRSAAQLFATISDPERGLKLLWRSEAVRSDPWVQAAEVALADAIGTSPRHGAKQLQALLNTKQIGVRYSELAAGLASLEWKSGVKRSKVKKLIRQSLARPTENALAQAVWLEAELDATLTTQQLIESNQTAHEARSRAAYEIGDYESCSSAAKEWFYDQPFSREAARDYVFVTGVHLNDYEKSLEVGRAALRLHPKDFSLLNGQLYASVMAGKVEDAKAIYNRMRSLRLEKDQLPFMQAGAGLLAFADGDIPAGRQHYLDAINHARDLKRPSLIINAYIYWLEREAIAGSLTREEVLENIGEVDESLKGLPKHISADNAVTWLAKKASIIDVIDKTERVVSKTIKVGNGRSVTYTLPAKHITEAMRRS